MSKYTDLLEHRAQFKSIKETMYQIGYSRENLELLTEQINKLSIQIRSLEPDESPTIIIDDVPIASAKPKLLLISSYKDFVEFYKENIINSINDQLNSIQVPISVYAIFKNAVVQSEHYIMNHHYNIYCSEVERSNQWIIHK